MFSIELLIGGILSLLGGCLCGVLLSFSHESSAPPPIAAILILLWAFLSDHFMSDPWEATITGVCFLFAALISGCIAGAQKIALNHSTIP